MKHQDSLDLSRTCSEIASLGSSAHHCTPQNISPEVIDVFGRIQVKTQIKQQLQRLICRPSTLSVPFFSFWPSVADGFSMPLQGSAGSAGSAGSTARASLGSQQGFNVGVCI
jgi:hypothetical protein